jgi:hypothetical protein
MRLASNVVVFVNYFFVYIERAEADDDAMYCRLATCFVAPRESAVGEMNMYALIQQLAP